MRGCSAAEVAENLLSLSGPLIREPMRSFVPPFFHAGARPRRGPRQLGRRGGHEGPQLGGRAQRHRPGVSLATFRRFLPSRCPSAVFLTLTRLARVLSWISRRGWWEVWSTAAPSRPAGRAPRGSRGALALLGPFIVCARAWFPSGCDRLGCPLPPHPLAPSSSPARRQRIGLRSEHGLALTADAYGAPLTLSGEVRFTLRLPRLLPSPYALSFPASSVFISPSRA